MDGFTSDGDVFCYGRLLISLTETVCSFMYLLLKLNQLILDLRDEADQNTGYSLQILKIRCI